MSQKILISLMHYLPHIELVPLNSFELVSVFNGPEIKHILKIQLNAVIVMHSRFQLV